MINVEFTHIRPGLPEELIAYHNNHNFGTFLSYWNGNFVYILLPFGVFYFAILLPFGVFYCHMICFLVSWYTFSRFGKLYQEKSGNPVSRVLECCCHRAKLRNSTF
jgi:hypothetical protein